MNREPVNRVGLLILLLALLVPAIGARAEQPLQFWDRQRKGANLFNKVETRERLETARDLGIEFIRLAADKWESDSRDFLIGSADEFTAIQEKDFTRLRTVLDQADELGLKVVYTCLSLPGARWRQLNGGKNDARLWTEEKYLEQTERFWRELAARLTGHPAIVGFNPLNEPHPERSFGFQDFRTQDVAQWYSQQVRGTPADLNRFNQRIVRAIREVDQTTPIILDAGHYAMPCGFHYLEPVNAPAVLYAVHMYEPFAFTCKRINNNRYKYPGKVAVGAGGKAIQWNRAELRRFLNPVVQWARRWKVRPGRIIVGEFGCDRRADGAAAYLSDLIDIFNERGWHWAFYAYREDTWDGMDYECGTGGLGWGYWKAVEAGEKPQVPRKHNPLFEVLAREFRTLPQRSDD
ncbi:MAG: cellulase family glycosylhydrolase [Phycisphaerae bacterium]|nr:cellulase family glycosylhydrolase [Phycisphaerae bacterium]